MPRDIEIGCEFTDATTGEEVTIIEAGDPSEFGEAWLCEIKGDDKPYLFYTDDIRTIAEEEEYWTEEE
jgi:hypothetical protein